MSRTSRLQKTLKLTGVSAAGKEASGIMTVRQLDARGADSFVVQTARQTLRRLLAAAVYIGIESDEHGTGFCFKQLAELEHAQMASQGAGGVAKSCLPQRGQIEHPLHQNDVGACFDFVPAVETPLGSRQKAVRGRRPNAPAIQVPLQGKHNAAAEGVTAFRVHQSCSPEMLERVTKRCQRGAQALARRIADSQLVNQFRLP